MLDSPERGFVSGERTHVHYVHDTGRPLSKLLKKDAQSGHSVRYNHHVAERGIVHLFRGLHIAKGIAKGLLRPGRLVLLEK
jgi:hypothetical protein